MEPFPLEDTTAFRLFGDRVGRAIGLSEDLGVTLLPIFLSLCWEEVWYAIEELNLYLRKIILTS